MGKASVHDMATSSRGKVLTQKQFHLFEADFAAIDENHTGAIDQCEIALLLEQQMSRAPTTNEVRLAMAQFDLNSDGLISFQEYVTTVCGPGWTVEGKKKINIQLLFERYAAVAANKVPRRRRRGSSSTPVFQRGAGFEALDAGLGNQDTLEFQRRMEWKHFLTMAKGCNIISEFGETPLIGSKIMLSSQLEEIYFKTVGCVPGTKMDVAACREALKMVKKFFEISEDELIDHMCEFGSNPTMTWNVLESKEGEKLKNIVGQESMEALRVDEWTPPEETTEDRLAREARAWKVAKSEKPQNANEEYMNDAHELRSLPKYGSNFNASGNDSGVDHARSAADGQELFERFAAFGVGRHGAELGQESGQLQNSEMDSSGFIKFFRDCKLCNEEPDNMPEAAVDIWSLHLTYPIDNPVDIPYPPRWATLKRDLPKDDRGQIHVNYEVFVEHVIQPLAQKKSMGLQLLTALCSSRLPKHRANNDFSLHENEHSDTITPAAFFASK